MKDFVLLLSALYEATSTLRKVKLIAEYLDSTSGRDRDLAIYILLGGTIKRLVSSTELRLWAAEYSGMPLWFIEECYHVVGDLAETLSLLCSSSDFPHEGSLGDWINFIEGLRTKPVKERKDQIFKTWRKMSQQTAFLFNKLLTGGLRIEVSKSSVIKALSKVAKLPEPEILYRLSAIDQASISFDLLTTPHDGDSLNPYPFYLAYGLEMPVEKLGFRTDWQVEWKWDGIRAQFVFRGGRLAIWSREEELLTETFPEFQDLLGKVKDGTVLDGEVIGWRDQQALPFSALQKRISRKKIFPEILLQCPVVFLAYDLLESIGTDIRGQPFSRRRELLEKLVDDTRSPFLITIAPIAENDWESIIQLHSSARANLSEGLMLKKLSSQYLCGRGKGGWWKWRVDPLHIDGVLVYAQKGHSHRSSLYTDYTFAVWNSGELVPFTKTYTGLSDAEIRQVDNYVKKNIQERFGPVRSVKPELVFELAFEGVQESKRHKSGIVLRLPRISRWRKDKTAAEADTIETLRALLKAE